MTHVKFLSTLVVSFIWFQVSFTLVTTHQILVIRQKQNHSNSSGTNLGDQPHAGQDSLRWAQGKLNFTVLEDSGHSLIHYETVSAFCDFIKSNAVSLIISLDRPTHPNLIDIFTKYSGIPLIKGFESYDEESVTPKQESSYTLHLRPNLESRLEVIFQLLKNYKWDHKVAVISQKDDIYRTKMADRLMTMLRRRQAMSKTGIFLNLTINKDDEVQKLKDIHILLSLRMEAIVILMEKDEAIKLLRIGELNGFLSMDTVWISAYSLAGVGTYHLPLLFKTLGIRVALQKSGNVSPPSREDFLKDSVTIFKEALKNVTMEDEVISVAPKRCSAMKSSESGDKLYQAMKLVRTNGWTGKIQFDSKGFRNNIECEVDYWIAAENQADFRRIVIGRYANNALTLFHADWPPTISTEDTLKMKHDRGEALNVVVPVQEPYVIKFDRGNKEENDCGIGLPCTGRDGLRYCCAGFCIDLLKRLIKDIGFSVRIHEVKDGLYGGLNRTTGQWSGVIGEVSRSEADIGVGCDMIINNQRSTVVDFTHPIMSASLMVAVKATLREKSNWTGFLYPFSVWLWISLLAAVNVTLFCIWWLEWSSPFGRRQRRKNDEDNHNPFSFVNTIWFTWSLVLPSYNVGKKPKSLASRTLALIFAFGMLITVTNYVANLAAFHVVQEEALPLSEAGIKDPKLKNPPDGFKIAILRDSTEESVFQSSRDAVLRRIWKHMKHNRVETFLDGIKKIGTGEIQAFVYDRQTLEYYAANSRDCSLKIVGKTFFESGFAWPVRKNSSLTRKISDAFLKYQSYEIIEKMKSRWFDGECKRLDGEWSGSFYRLTSREFAGTFLVVCGGTIISIIFLILESFCGCIRNRSIYNFNSDCNES